MTEHPSLKTPGGMIRAAREAQGVSLPEMSERTKIPSQVIEAIERDEYHKVSGALYIKSFLRTCAVEMGLEAEEILDLYARFSGEVRPQAGGGEAVWEDPEVKISRIGLPWRLISVVGVVLVLFGVLMLMMVRGCDRGTEQLPATAEVIPEQDIPAGDQDTVVENEAAPRAAVKVDKPDTLARAWVSGVDKADDKKIAVEAKPVVVPISNVQQAPPAATPTRTALPMPLTGASHLVFAGGQKKAVVLRIICDKPVTIQVKRDAEQVFEEAQWPQVGTEAPALPPTGIEPGRVYASTRGFVVYWGAGDHLSLRLDRTEGVEVALNGKLRDVQNLRPGGELLLDAHGD